MAKKVLISAGEPSGDMHAARLLREMMELSPSLEARGMGGSRLKEAGMHLDIDISEQASAMGFLELGRKIPSLLKALSQLKSIIKKWKPDLLIIVDFADFNLSLAKYAKEMGVPVFYYIPPKVWAWRPKRIKLIRKYTDLIGVIFPFEKKFFEEQGIKNVVYLGHPFAEEIEEREEGESYKEERKAFLEAIGLNPDRPVISIFCGSREGEIRRHADIIAPTVSALCSMQKDVQFIVSIAEGIKEEAFWRAIPQELKNNKLVSFVKGRSREILRYSDVGILKSGTCNLEAALSGLPFVMFFKVTPLSELIVRLFVKTNVYSIVNILKDGTVKELLQKNCKPGTIAAEAHKLLSNSNARTLMLRRFELIRRELEHREEKKHNKASMAELALKLAGRKEKPRHVLKRVLSYLKPYKWLFAAALVCMVIYGASDGVVPLLLKQILDGIFREQNEHLLYALPFFLIAFSLIRAAADFGQQYLTAKVGHNVIRDIRNDINSHLLGLSSDFFYSFSSADLISRITSDVLLIKTFLTDCAAAILRDSVRIISLLAAAIYLDPVLALIAFVAFPAGIYPVYSFGKMMRKLSRKGQEDIGELSSKLQESVLGHRVVKAFCREKFEQERFEEKNEQLTKTFFKTEKIRAVSSPVNEILASLAIAGIVFYGGASVINGDRTQGEFIAFLASIFLLYDPFKKLSRMNATVQQGLSGAQRIFEVLDTRSSIQDPPVPKKMPSSNFIEFVDVDFAYGVDTRLVLQNINLTVPEGSKVAIVGLSGAGKSTLIDLVPRFIDPNKGVVKIGGMDIREVSLSELRSRIALVSQHTFLFNDTVFNNILYGKPDASYEEVLAASKKANAYGFIQQLRDGFETIIGEGGYTLSGGERQRIAIARALLKDAPILILDEATASLDNESEREVKEALAELEKDRTCIVIAHRLSTVMDADKIVVMKHGEIVETGTHEQLLKLNGEYAKLYMLQFKQEDAGSGFIGDEELSSHS
ncbi:MAG: lipid-A-disaccharide synthase [Candidatus Dadabacteria bacterium]|nr:MAG: lipid-A-disaccharide synthase [Candidatus Dadabacteria bacterium]